MGFGLSALFRLFDSSSPSFFFFLDTAFLINVVFLAIY